VFGTKLRGGARRARAAGDRKEATRMHKHTFIRRLRDEHGITGLETAIVLIAFVTVSAIFAFVVLSTGLFSAERGKETVFAGLSKTRGSLTLSGGLLATSDQTEITALTFDVTLAAGGDSVSVDPSATNGRTVISYIDDAITDADLTYTVDPVVGNGDNVLQPGEMMEINIDLTQNAQIALGANDTFTLEIKPPSGSFLVVRRTTPASISDTVIDLN
jgi:flagellin FlaB